MYLILFILKQLGPFKIIILEHLKVSGNPHCCYSIQSIHESASASPLTVALVPDRCWPNCLAIYGVFGCLVIYSFRLLWSMNKFWNKGWGAFGQNTVFLGCPVFVVHHRELINILDYKQIPGMAIKYWTVTVYKHHQLNIFLINMLLFTNKESAVGYKQETREHRAGHQWFWGLGLKLGASTWKHK